MSKLCIISDTHGSHEELTIPQCDILIHCGDFSWTGKYREVKEFVEWLEKQSATYKICIAGNHDMSFDSCHPRYDESVRTILAGHPDKNIHYLENSSVIIEGVKYYGTPWTPFFFDWGFNGITDENMPFERGVSLSQMYSEIPNDVGVLICHGPPHGILDWSEMGDERTGSIEMRKLISYKLKKLQLYLCGHIHEGRGVEIVDDVTYINASSLGRDYQTIYPPVVIQLDDNGRVDSVEGLS